jgi:hypothetical protein
MQRPARSLPRVLGTLTLAPFALAERGGRRFMTSGAAGHA